MQIPWFDPQEILTSPLSTGSVCRERPPEASPVLYFTHTEKYYYGLLPKMSKNAPCLSTETLNPNFKLYSACTDISETEHLVKLCINYAQQPD